MTALLSSAGSGMAGRVKFGQSDEIWAVDSQENH